IRNAAYADPHGVAKYLQRQACGQRIGWLDEGHGSEFFRCDYVIGMSDLRLALIPFDRTRHVTLLALGEESLEVISETMKIDEFYPTCVIVTFDSVGHTLVIWWWGPV